MVIFLTGARGFLGRHVARHASSMGATVIGLGHGAWTEPDYRDWGVSDWLNGEVSHANLDTLAMRYGPPYSVIHLAGGSSVGPSFAAPAEDFLRTVKGTAELLEWIRLRAPDTRAVLASSAAVYGAGHVTPIAEDAICMPFSPYGFHKRMAELVFESYGRNFGLNVAIVRLFSVYGPEVRKQLLWDACSRLIADERVLALGGTGSECRDWFHVGDAARLLTHVLSQSSPSCPVVNGGTGAGTTVREIAHHLCRCWGATAEPVFSGQSRVGDPAHLVADTTRLATFSLEPPQSWREGLDEYVAWFKKVNRVSR